MWPKKQLKNSSLIKVGRPSSLTWWQGRLNGYNWDGIPNKVVQFKQGEYHTYPDKPPFWTGGPNIMPVKNEGWPIDFNALGDLISTKAGDWWSVRLDMYHLHIYFRYRSWTKNIFYVAWD